jgi:SAM-dependent methyltransferase/glycosyltransferase involved in cell wall biosynthesis
MGILQSGGRWICARVLGDALAVGWDEGEAALQLGREGHRVAELDAARAGELPYEDASFDTVVLGGFLAGWASCAPPIGEARRVLRPGGRLIVAVPYAGDPGDDTALSLRGLLGELAGFSLGEMATVGGRLCLVAERAREKSRAAAWRRALGVAERQLAEREGAAAALRASLAELEASREREARALADARGDVERLEAALAAATHQRDRREEEARLAGEGVAVLEQRLERLQREAERERAEAEREGRAALEAVERELAVVRVRLEVREEEFERSFLARGELESELSGLRERLGERELELGVRERDLAARVRELGLAGEQLIARESELEAANESLGARERELEAAATLLERQGEELAGARRALDEVRTRLEARERHLRTAQLGVEARDRRLEVAEGKLATADRSLGSRQAELARAQAAARDGQRKLALAEARLEKAQERAERFKGSLVELRSGRAYRLMRVLWRLRRPFKRAPRQAGGGEAPLAEEEPDSPAPAPEPPPPAPGGERLRVATILDEISAACFAPECELVPLTLEGWDEQLDERRPDLLLVESAWSGNGGEWQYRIARYPRQDLAGLPALRALLAGCRERGIPTAFWNKEDPVHFERFAEAASLFDHVFTTDSRCAARYRALPGERTVTPLPFAAQPRIHNPAAVVEERSASPCFAGAWYRDRHPDRREALAALLDAARPRGLVIYDRSFGGDDEAFGFPERFQPHVLGGLPYERILDVYKSHRVFLNANSVADSPTMCSRRVFELAACDTAILSTPGAALSALLGDAVLEAGDEGSAAAALERLLGDEAERARRTRAARRAVFAEHTYAARLATIAETAGLDASSLRREPFAVPGASGNGAASEGPGPASGPGDEHPWLLQLAPGVALSETALADARAAAAFADADVIGTRPASNGEAPAEHRYVTDVDPRALLIRRELAGERGWPPGPPEQLRARLREWSDEGVRIYAADADWLPA